MIACDCLQRQGTGPRDSEHLSLSSISSVLKAEEPIRSSGLNFCMIQAIDLDQLLFAEPSNLSDLGVILPSSEKETLYICLYLYIQNFWSLFKEKWRQVTHAVWKQMRELTSFLEEVLACRLQPRRVCPKELFLFPLRKRGSAIFSPLINPEWGRWARQILHIAISLPLLSCHFRGANQEQMGVKRRPKASPSVKAKAAYRKNLSWTRREPSSFPFCIEEGQATEYKALVNYMRKWSFF